MTETVGPAEMRVLIYARAARSGDGLARQVQALRAYATDQGWGVAGNVAEVEPWGPSPAALDALRAAPVVLVQDLSRLGRDIEAALSAYEALAAAGVRVLLAGGGRATVNPTLDAMNRALTAVMVEHARQQHSMRVGHGLARRREARA